jgi:hypothetical protein
MNEKPKCRLRAAVAAGVVGLLMTGCGGGGTTTTTSNGSTTPTGWGTLNTDRLSVAYPKNFKKVAVDKRNRFEVARARLTEDGTTVAAMSVEFDYGTNMHTAETAGIGAEARIQLGGTPIENTKVKVAGPGGPEEARMITYTFATKGRTGEPPKGTRMEGIMVAGVDDQSRPYLITVNSTPGVLSNRDVSDIIGSIALN